MKIDYPLCENVDYLDLLEIAEKRFPEYKSDVKFDQIFNRSEPFVGNIVCIHRNALVRAMIMVIHEPSIETTILLIDKGINFYLGVLLMILLMLTPFMLCAQIIFLHLLPRGIEVYMFLGSYVVGAIIALLWKFLYKRSFIKEVQEVFCAELEKRC